MAKYAANTTVSISRSREELERTLERFGANGQMWMRDDETKMMGVAFKRKGRGYRFSFRILSMEDARETPTGRYDRTDKVAREAADQENRRRFRSLANFIKAIMDAEDTGIISAEDALLPYLVLPSGKTVAQEAVPLLQQLESGHVNMKALLAGSGS